MKFTRSAEQQDMAAALGALLESADIPSIARAWGADDRSAWRDVWQHLAAMGAAGVVVEERHGGLGGAAEELVTCLEELGYSGLPGPVVETTAFVPRLLAPSELADGWLSSIAAGTTVGTVAFAEHVPYALDADLADAVLDCDGERAFLLERPPMHRQDSFDPARRLFSIRERPAAQPLTGADPSTAFDWAVLGCAAQLLGIGRRLVEKSTAYVGERQQFGRAIGEYQAVKHQLADAWLGLRFARPLLHGACVSMNAGAPCASRDASIAKITAADAAYTAARAALQVHGAMGYTVENDLHLWLTKATALHTAWGTNERHRERVATALRRDAESPVGGQAPAAAAAVEATERAYRADVRC